jgi:hypothetical protein
MDTSEDANRNSETENTVSVEFPEGYGDFTFKSIDHVVFHFPLFLLAHASPVFGDMHKIGTNLQESDIIVLSETRSTLEMLLCLIDPAKDNPALDWECVGHLLEAAEKYQIKNIFSWFEKEVSFEVSNSSPPTLKHPMLCLGLADRFDLRYLVKLALRQAITMPIKDIQINHYIGARMVGHFFTLRAARIEKFCRKLFLWDHLFTPCEFHRGIHTPAMSIIPTVVRVPSLAAFMRALDRDMERGCKGL